MAVRSLKSQADVQRALAWLWREIEATRIPVDRGRCLIYCALSLSQVLSEHDLEARVKTLEAAVPLRRSA